jgi:hypothetical protein
MIQGAGLYSNQNFIGLNLGVRGILVLQNFRPTVLMKSYGFHDPLPFIALLLKGMLNRPH